ncbi:unnamed protein product [Amoebophrya sp. A25]|nr:unnamed protein product [Amoebophrya sp. A25]|eukprot:GSA25T00025891001.1
MSTSPPAVTVIVTGAGGRIGTEIIRQLMQHFLQQVEAEGTTSSVEIIAVLRSREKGEALVEKVLASMESGGSASSKTSKRQRSASGEGATTEGTKNTSTEEMNNNNVKLTFEVCDVSSKTDVQALAKRFGPSRPLSILINNAAVTPERQQFTKEGIDLQWATNVLGYHWMIDAFASNLELGHSKIGPQEALSPSVVNVASFYAGELDVDDPEFKNRPYDVDESYRASKMANRMQSKGWAERLKARGIRVNAVHPGIATSKVSLGLGFDLDRSQGAAEECAKGPVTVALQAAEPKSSDLTGLYFDSVKRSKCKWQEDKAGVAKLMALCDGY